MSMELLERVLDVYVVYKKVYRNMKNIYDMYKLTSKTKNMVYYMETMENM